MPAKAYKNPKADQRRNAALGKIHIAKKQLGLSDDVYRAMLLTHGGVKSSKDLTPEGIDKVIRHLEHAGAVFTKSKQHGRRPHNIDSKAAKSDQLKKIEALLTDRGLPWTYAGAMAAKMYSVDALEFCDHKQLNGIISALVIQAKRLAKRDGGE